ncbi:MAG: hypothetical protein K2X29_04130, partial [Candidatus Obscuribacterales bacterium]|nr:hypothetical protein [Candidatus Obscuribacterales bacterium]
MNRSDINMFSGIVEEVGTVLAVSGAGEGKRFRIGASQVTSDLKTGDSVSVAGTCLTSVLQEKDLTLQRFFISSALPNWQRLKLGNRKFRIGNGKFRIGAQTKYLEFGSESTKIVKVAVISLIAILLVFSEKHAIVIAIAKNHFSQSFLVIA